MTDPAQPPQTARDRLLANLGDDDVMYDHPASMSGEPMDPVLFVRWDALLAAGVAFPEAADPAQPPQTDRDRLANLLAEVLHDAMCRTSHHDPQPGGARCNEWPKYPQIAAFVAPRLIAANVAFPEPIAREYGGTPATDDRLRAATFRRLVDALDLVLSMGPGWNEGDWAAITTDLFPLIHGARAVLADAPAASPFEAAIADPVTRAALDAGLADLAAGRVRPWTPGDAT